MSFREVRVDTDKHNQFAELFIRSQGRLYAHIAMMLPNKSDAEDIFQQTSLILWRKWDQYDPSRDFLGWACGIARNEVRNFLRRRGDHMILDSEMMERLADMHLQHGELLDQRRQLLAECVKKRQDFSHRGADAKSLLDEVLCRGREERGGASWKGEWGSGGRGEWGGGFGWELLGTRAA